jgi:hypothetical protein
MAGGGPSPGEFPHRARHPIATFDSDGSYTSESGNRAAIYLSQDDHGIWVYDQWRGRPVHTRLIPFEGGSGTKWAARATTAALRRHRVGYRVLDPSGVLEPRSCSAPRHPGEFDLHQISEDLGLQPVQLGLGSMNSFAAVLNGFPALVYWLDIDQPLRLEVRRGQICQAVQGNFDGVHVSRET